MELTFLDRGKIEIEDARLLLGGYLNFTGREGRWNREGERYFHIVIPNDDLAEALRERGLNVKIKAPRNEDDSPLLYMEVKVRYHKKGSGKEHLNPYNTFLIADGKMSRLTEDTIDILDSTDIKYVDMIINASPYRRDDGSYGHSAYLNSIWVTQEVSRFDKKYAMEECPEEEPFE